MIIISNIQEKILRELAKYKFLTAKHLLNIGVSKNASFIQKSLKLLQNYSLIDKTDVGFIPTVGKSSNIYFLTKRGFDALIENTKLDISEIQYPKSKGGIFSNDYRHRVNTISVWIEIEKWIENTDKEMDFVDTYFQSTGNNKTENKLKAKTRLDFTNGKHIDSDLIFRYKTAQDSFLYCLEVYNDYQTTRVLTSLKHYLTAGKEGTASRKYKHHKGFRILAVFEDGQTMDNAIKKLQIDNEFQGLSKFFLFKSLQNISNGFAENWIDLNNNFINL